MRRTGDLGRMLFGDLKGLKGRSVGEKVGNVKIIFNLISLLSHLVLLLLSEI